MSSELHVLRWPIMIFKTILTQIHVHNWIIFKIDLISITESRSEPDLNPNSYQN